MTGKMCRGLCKFLSISFSSCSDRGEGSENFITDGLSLCVYRGEKSEPLVKTISRVMTTADEK